LACQQSANQTSKSWPVGPLGMSVDFSSTEIRTVTRFVALNFVALNFVG
jgi:hypothetical protein